MHAPHLVPVRSVTAAFALVTLTLTLSLSGTSCEGCGTPVARACDAASDCLDGDVCVVSGGVGVCETPIAEGEGEGEEGEGEEGEGEEGEEGEGEGGEGEGEAGEGEGEPGCGNSIPEAGEACDDGNDDELDACTSDCTLTSARLEPIAGVTPPGELAIALPASVAVFGDQLYVADEARIMATRFDETSGDVVAPWLRVSGRAVSRDVTFSEESFAEVPISMAVDGAGNVYFVPASRDRVLVQRPGSVDADLVLGGGDTSAFFDPPAFTYVETATQLSFGEILAVDVAPDGTVFALTGEPSQAPPNGRVVKVVAGVVEVVAGRYGAGTGTAAQTTLLGELTDISLALFAGEPNGLWIAVGDDNVRFVAFGDGSTTLVAGDGILCEGGSLSSCEIEANLIADDGDSGFYALDLAKRGIFHVSPSDNTVLRVAGDATAPFSGTAGNDAIDARDVFIVPQDLAYAAGHLFFTDAFASSLYRLDVAAAPSPLTVVAHAVSPAPERATDRGLGFYRAVALSDDAVFVATTNAIWRVALADRSASVVLTQENAGPCSDLSFDRGLADDLVVTNGGGVLFFAQSGNPDRVCRHVVNGGTEVFLDGADGLTDPRALALLDDESELWVLDDSGLLRFAAIDGSPLGSEPVGVASLIEDFDAHSDCNYSILRADETVAVHSCFAAGLLDIANAPANPEAVSVFDSEIAIVIGDDGVLRFDGGGVFSTLAGVAPGFADGDVGAARIESEVVDIATGSGFEVVIASPTSVRIFDGDLTSDVITIVGSDARSDDGRLTEARFLAPLSFSCATTRCIVAEPALGTFRSLDLLAGRIDRVFGSDGVPAVPAVALAAMVDDDHFAWPDVAGGGVVELTLDAPGLPAQIRSDDPLYDGVTAIRVVDVAGNGDVTLLTAGADGGISVTGPDIANIRSEPISGGFLTAVAATPRPPLESDLWRAWAIDGERFIQQLDLNADDLDPQLTNVFASVTAIALDANDNIIVVTNAGIGQLETVEGELVTLGIRPLVPSGDPLLPLASCSVLLDRAGDDVLAVDGCTGAVLRLVVE